MPASYDSLVSLEIHFEGGGVCEVNMLKSSADRLLKEVEKGMKGEKVGLYRFRVSGVSADAEVMLLQPEKVVCVRFIS